MGQRAPSNRAGVRGPDVPADVDAGAHRQLHEHLAEGTAMVGAEGVVAFANHRLGELLGAPLRDVLGQSLMLWVPPSDRAVVGALLAEAPVASAGRVHAETVLLAADGTDVPVTLTAAPLDGALVGLVVAERVTRQGFEAEVDEAVRRRTAELEQTVRELESFTTSAAHDLRAPLRTLSEFSSALLEEYGDQLDTTALGYVRRCREATLRLGEQLDGLVQLALASRQELTVATVDLSALARDVAAELWQAEPARRATIGVEGGITASADPVLIRIVLENLFGNAWKFTAGRGQARIEFGRLPTHDGDGMHLFVRDNGVGFDPSGADEAFVPFSRLHSPADYPGTGVGLASVQRIVTRHGGRVWAEAVPDEGATFHFTLDS